MNLGSPLNKDQKVPKKDKEDKPIERFKPEKPVISKADAKKFVESPCDPQQILWIERWLTQFVQENSYPPQMREANAWSAIHQFLLPQQVDGLLKCIQTDFRSQYPVFEPMRPYLNSEGFDFLLAEESSLECQRTSLTADHK